MTSSSNDRLVALTTIETYDGFSIVKIPGAEHLTDAERAAILYTAQNAQNALPNPELLSRLQCMTPPLDEDDALCDAIASEANARQALEHDGCPPCLPESIEPPHDHAPEECRGIIGYWKSLPGTGYLVLCAQLDDWQKFRMFQKSRYRNNDFDEYLNQVRNRRRRFHLGDTVFLLQDSTQQSRSEDWKEYQDYHITRWLSLNDRRQSTRRELELALDSDGGEHEDNKGILQSRLGFYDTKLQQQSILLQWTEQKRLTVVDASQRSRGVYENSSTITAAVRPGQQKQWKTPSASAMYSTALEPRTSTTRSRLRSSQPSKLAASIRDKVAKTARTTSGRRSQTIATARSTDLLRSPGTGKTQKRKVPRTVLEVDGANATSCNSTRAAAKILRTRSGRISKPPIRWSPDLR